MKLKVSKEYNIRKDKSEIASQMAERLYKQQVATCLFPVQE